MEIASHHRRRGFVCWVSERRLPLHVISMKKATSLPCTYWNIVPLTSLGLGHIPRASPEVYAYVMDARPSFFHNLLLLTEFFIPVPNYIAVYSNYTVSQKGPTFKLFVTLSNLNRFSKFLHCWKEYEICYKAHSTVPRRIA